MNRIFLLVLAVLAQIVSSKIFSGGVKHFEYGAQWKQSHVGWSESGPYAHGYDYTSYIYGPGCRSAERMRYPRTHAEVVAIVKEALERKVTVKAVGARHSATDIICTDGIPVDMHGIHEMALDSDNVVTTGAGATVGQLTEYLASKGRGFPIIPCTSGNVEVSN